MYFNGKHLGHLPCAPLALHYNPFGHVLFLSLFLIFSPPLSIFLFPAFSFAYWEQNYF